MRRWLFVSMALTCGCNSASIDPEFQGTWSGFITSTNNTSGTFGGMIAYQNVLSMTVGDTSLAALGLCLASSTGSIMAIGMGDRAEWQGNLPCQSVSVGKCASVFFTYTAATFSLAAPNGYNGRALEFEADTGAEGCGVNGQFELNFTGYHPL